MDISEIMGLVFIFLLCIGGIFPLLIGLLTIYHWAKPAKPPADESNRINRVSSWWIGLTRPEVLAQSWEYYQNDVLDNMEAIEGTAPSRRAGKPQR